MTKQVIVSTRPFEFTREQISESISENDGRLIVRGVLQKAREQNQNGRVYTRELLERESSKYQELINDKRALGELDHPDSAVVNLQNVSHNVKKMWWDGDSLLGDVEVLSTPSGNILKELFKSGIKLGISSRGMGSVKEVMKEGENTLEVQPDFELIAFDFVSNPSTHGAFMHPMNESVDKDLPAGRTCGEYCKVESIINDIMRG